MKLTINRQFASLLFLVLPLSLHASDRPALGIAIADDPAGGAIVTAVYLGRR